MTYFIFCIHNHQPVGNFEDVLENAYANSYEPFLRKLHGRPSIKLSLHISGFLLDWLCERKPGYIEMLKDMAARGQVELMGGGYYEPVLAVIPREDRLGQLNMMKTRIQDVFGQTPKGIWLTERVWDPTLPESLVPAGVEYVVVDDYHFIKSGLKKEDLLGCYVTEELGNVVKVFPGSERLRYLIPFEPADKFEQYINEIGNGGKGNAAIFADDGEKFGVWPGTRRWVFDEGWLDSFLDRINSLSGRLKPVTFSEYLEKEEPLGRVYLPTTSYMEMGEWALPAEASREYTALVEEVKTWKDGERVKRFLQGGMWRNFFAKYPEANWMHKRMLSVSRALQEAGKSGMKDGALGQAKTYLYKAQCNDAYWHGVFGGLYLPHLRREIYENLIKAEGILLRSHGDSVEAEAVDIDRDTFDEVAIRAETFNLFFSPRRGGSLVEADWKPGALNIGNTLTRWFEGYHMKLKEAAGGGEGASAKSIHGAITAKEEGLERHLKFDTVQKTSFRDSFFANSATVEAFSSGKYSELGDFRDGKYGFTLKEKGVIMKRQGIAFGLGVSITKEAIVTGADSFSMNYRVETEAHNSLPKDSMLGVEFSFCMPGCNGPVCHYEFLETGAETGAIKHGLGSIGSEDNMSRFSATDGYGGLRLVFIVSRPVTVWRYPIETVSLSEAGFERIYQGSSVVFVLPVDSEAPLEFSIRVKFESCG
ncbi:MAG: alpha-amylase/4-alpha-glucanotransferase domain-containing protein [Thermodesulfobacteriota bacterium]